MRISKYKLNIVLTRKCMSLFDLKTEFSPHTLVRINNGAELRNKTIGRLAKILECDPLDIIAKEEE